MTKLVICIDYFLFILERWGLQLACLWFYKNKFVKCECARMAYTLKQPVYVHLRV